MAHGRRRLVLHFGLRYFLALGLRRGGTAAFSPHHLAPTLARPISSCTSPLQVPLQAAPAHCNQYTKIKCIRRSVGPLSTSQTASNDEADTTVSLMLDEVQLAESHRNVTRLSDYIESLEVIGSKGGLHEEEETDPKRFDALLGLYDVSFVKTAKEGDNPVGGKWTRKNGFAQKILRTRRSFQHILKVNETGCGATKVRTSSGGETDVVAEAVNVVSLDALWGLIRASVILRGDAIALNATERVTDTCQPLSARAVRALFDAPRIVFGKTGRWLNINVGPRTSVVLDATYVDNRARIGLGGRSGSRFIFQRCRPDDLEANEFRALLSKRPRNRRKTVSALLAIAAGSTYGAVVRRDIIRFLACTCAAISFLIAALIAFSGGGIEANDRSVAEAKKILQ